MKQSQNRCEGAAGQWLALGLAAFIVGTATASAQKSPTVKTPTACEDFYEHVNEAWLRKAPALLEAKIAAKAKKPSGGMPTELAPYVDGFGEVADRIKVDMTKLLTNAQKSAATTKDPLTRALGNFYASCLVAKPLWGVRKEEKDGGAARCYDATDTNLRIALGRAFVRDVLHPSTKARAEAMLGYIRMAMEARLRANTWMSPTTKEAALAKLAAMRFSVGYAEREDDYSGLVLSPTDYNGNLKAIVAFLHAREIRNDSTQTDPNVRQYTVNAFYVPTRNLVEIPMGMLQPPYFDPTKDGIENYAAIGGILGHEITHAFDPQGAKYDAKGKYENWWLPSDTIKFNERTGKLADQYDQFTLFETIRVSGRSTLNENVADLGGLNIAYDAYKLWKKSTGTTSTKDEVAEDQQFFKAFATIERSIYSRQFAEWIVTQDIHSPNKWRANGVLANMPAFAKAFGCKEGDPMVQPPDKRSEIW